MTDDDEMPFGKYRGTKMEHVPASYLLWLWNDGMWEEERSGPVRDYIVQNFNHLETECPDTIIDHRPS